VQGSHTSWKTWKITKKIPGPGNVLRKILLVKNPSE